MLCLAADGHFLKAAIVSTTGTKHEPAREEIDTLGGKVRGRKAVHFHCVVSIDSNGQREKQRVRTKELFNCRHRHVVPGVGP